MNKNNKIFLKNALPLFALFSSISSLLFANINDTYYMTFAHSYQLSVTYDDCSPSVYGDGEYEKWYELVYYGPSNNNFCHHLPHPVSNYDVKYYISETKIGDNSFSWDTYLNNFQKDALLSCFSSGIIKWAGINYFLYDGDGFVIKKPIANFTQGTADDYNIIIYPDNPNASNSYLLTYVGRFCTPVVVNDGTTGIAHRHYDQWEISVPTSTFLSEYTTNSSNTLAKYSRAFTHEIGHVFGLKDMYGDSCNTGFGDHHYELLMGDSDDNNFQSNITYKDLIGAAITRDYHTDSDHKWIYDATSSPSGKYKLICSICNGVKIVDSLSNQGPYVLYKACNNDHSLSGGNMFAVASYLNYDYYKCKYCRYVAPFSNIIEQNYEVSYYSNLYHQYTNQVNGLNYSILENHNVVNNSCTICYEHIHSYTYSSTKFNHTGTCSVCNHTYTEPHIVHPGISGGFFGTCIVCGRFVNIGDTPIIHESIEPFYISDGGSYITQDGIIVLSDEDVEKYYKGTLEFHLFGEISE